MDSKIVEQLKPEFEPVAIVWSDTIPPDSLQFKEGKFGCILNLFAEASRRGRIAGGSRSTIICSGARAALGLGDELTANEESIDHYAALFSKGLASARHRDAYRAKMTAARPSWRPMLEFGERRHASVDLATDWLLNGMPRYLVDSRYVLFVPLSKVKSDENIRAIIFPLSPLELSGLVTLLASVSGGVDPIQVPPGADCFRIAGYACAHDAAEAPRAVLGMLDVDGREVMRRRFRDDVLSLTVPMPLYRCMEREASNSVLQLPAWSKLKERAGAPTESPASSIHHA
jgi:hypothetical protein